MRFQPPEQFNLADYFLEDRLREGKGDRVALVTERGSHTYAEVSALSNRFGNLLREAGVQQEQRVIIALPDGPEFAAALFGTVKIGAVVVMVNPYVRVEEIEYFYGYTRAKAAIVHRETAPAFADAATRGAHPEIVITLGDARWDRQLATASDRLDPAITHRDDAAIWLFSGGTTGHPKAVVQAHRSFANTTECYAKGVLGLTEDDVTLAVPKLFFGYATGSNLFFPFAVGARAALFGERCTPEVLFDKIATFRPTVLVNVPTMINQMVSHSGDEPDLSSLRLVTSAGEALPVELHNRWQRRFGVELLDGLGTAEMWHIFLSNRPGAARPGTLGTVVPGFEVRVSDADGNEVAPGEVGALWVRGDSRALGYWQLSEKTAESFRGEWYVSGDMVSCDEDGYFTYGGRADDMLKVSGKWLSPQEVENCLLQHPKVREAAVVGVVDDAGLTQPHAFVVPSGASADLPSDLASFVRDRLAGYKVPRAVTLVDDLPRTHLGKVDRGRLRAGL
ncbi:MAG TPA: benzoate-CoA ligase family protein [Gemmatimonadales bacterium]